MSKNLYHRFAILLSSIILFITCDEPTQPDTTPPTVTITSAFSGPVSEIVIITVMVTDNAGIDKVELWVDGDFTGIIDDTEPYTLVWNTTTYEDGSLHIIVVRAYDKNENTSDSNPLTLTVDNSGAVPTAVDVNVRYADGTFIVSWTRNNDLDFMSYSLYESDMDDISGGIQLYETTDQSDTTYTVGGIGPGDMRYYWVTVTDTFELERNSDIAVGVVHLILATFESDWYDPDIEGGTFELYLLIHDEEGNLLADTLITDGSTYSITPSSNVTILSEKISVTTVEILIWDDGNNSIYPTTNFSVNIGSDWKWKYPYTYYEYIGEAELLFQNVPDHSGYIISWPPSIGSISFGTLSDPYIGLYKSPIDMYLRLNIGDTPQSTWIYDISVGDSRTVDFNNVSLDNTTEHIFAFDNLSNDYSFNLFGFVESGNRYGDRYVLEGLWGDDSTYVSSLNYYIPGYFQDYYSYCRHSFDQGYWYQSLYGEIPSAFTRINADFEFISYSSNEFEIQADGTFDVVRANWSYNDLGWLSYGQNTSENLPEIPEYIKQKSPGIDWSGIQLTRLSLIDHSELSGYDEVIQNLFESDDYFYNVVNDYRNISRYPDTGLLRKQRPEIDKFEGFYLRPRKVAKHFK